MSWRFISKGEVVLMFLESVFSSFSKVGATVLIMESGQEVGGMARLVAGDNDDLTLVLIQTFPDASSGTA